MTSPLRAMGDEVAIGAVSLPQGDWKGESMMSTRVEFCAGNYTHQLDTQIEAVITDVLNKHPFFSATVTPPVHVTIRVALGDITAGIPFRTSINYDSFLIDQTVDLMIERQDLHQGSNSFNPACIAPRCLERTVAHELGHFIDACLDQAFQYARTDRPSGTLLKILYDLWNSYLDSRLGPLADCDLQQRQEEASAHGVSASLIERAWNGDFETYSALLTAARGVPSVER
jgi:hypothetical protein